jgi:myosin heavy subunit
MTDQLNLDVRKALDDVLKERDDVAMRQETEEALLKSTEKINELVSSLEAKDNEASALVTKVDELEKVVAELSGKVSALTTEKENLEKEKTTFQAEKDELLKRAQAVEETLANITKDQLAKTRFDELKISGVATTEAKAMEGQLAKVREMTDEEFAAYKNERVELRKVILAELEAKPAPVVEPAAVVEPVVVPAPVVEPIADTAVVEPTEEELAAAAVASVVNPMNAMAAALNMEIIPTQDDKVKYNALGAELAKRVKERKRQ